MRPMPPSRPGSRLAPGAYPARAVRSRPLRGLLAVAAFALALAGCSGNGTNVNTDTIDSDVAKAKQTWKLTLEEPGLENAIALEAMDIYLVDDDEQWPEIFEITGPEVTLVGAFPMDVHVGYQNAFERLFGKSVNIDARGGDPHDPKSSTVRIRGLDVPILGGTITFEKATGKWAGEQGDQTLWGRVELRVPGADGERTVRGSFAVHAITWG